MFWILLPDFRASFHFSGFFFSFSFLFYFNGDEYLLVKCCIIQSNHTFAMRRDCMDHSKKVYGMFHILKVV